MCIVAISIQPISVCVLCLSSLSLEVFYIYLVIVSFYALHNIQFSLSERLGLHKIMVKEGLCTLHSINYVFK